MASKYKLGNLTVILDSNDVQLDGFVRDILPIEPVTKKWRSFGWHVVEADGHDMQQVLNALDTVDSIRDQPKMIVAHPTKGKGVSYMENQSRWHGRAPNDDEYEQAVKELSRSRSL